MVGGDGWLCSVIFMSNQTYVRLGWVELGLSWGCHNFCFYYWKLLMIYSSCIQAVGKTTCKQCSASWRWWRRWKPQRHVRPCVLICLDALTGCGRSTKEWLKGPALFRWWDTEQRRILFLDLSLARYIVYCLVIVRLILTENSYWQINYRIWCSNSF